MCASQADLDSLQEMVGDLEADKAGGAELDELRAELDEARGATQRLGHYLGSALAALGSEFARARRERDELRSLNLDLGAELIRVRRELQELRGARS